MGPETFSNLLDELEIDLQEKIVQKRGVVLDVAEALFCESAHWPTLRRKLLGFFGESGLQRDIADIIRRVRKDYQDERKD